MELPTDFPEEMQFLFQSIKEYLVKTRLAFGDDAMEWRIKLNFWEFIINIGRQLMEKKCQKMSLKAEILSLCILMSYFRFNYEAPFHPFSDTYYQRDLQLDHETFSARINPKKLEEILVTPYKYVHTVVSQKYDVVGKFGMCGNVGLMELLLRFGAVPLKRLEVPILQEYDNDPQQPTPVFIILYEEGLKDLCDRNIDIFRLRNLQGPSKISRTFFVARILEALVAILEEPHNADQYIACLKLLYKSIPEPFVTSSEIEDFYQTIVSGDIPQGRISAISRCLEEYFSNSSQLPSPRSLKHLSRCEIRDSLRQAESLPTGVESLPLPRKLKDYILLKE